MAQNHTTTSTATLNSDSSSAEPRNGIGIDFVSRYAWRGQPYKAAKPAFQPYIDLSPFKSKALRDLKFCLWYTTNFFSSAVDAYQELDFSVKYTFPFKKLSFLTIGLADYYFPCVAIENNNGENKSIWSLKTNSTCSIDLTAQMDFFKAKDDVKISFPLNILFSTFLLGADYYTDKFGNRQKAYSSYLEIKDTVIVKLSEDWKFKVLPYIGVVLKNKGSENDEPYYLYAKKNGMSIVTTGIRPGISYKAIKNYEFTFFVDGTYNPSALQIAPSADKLFFAVGLSFFHGF